MSSSVKEVMSEILVEMAEKLESDRYYDDIKIGLTIDGSEHGSAVMKEALRLIQNKAMFKIVLIGTKVDWAGNFEYYETKCDADNHQKMEELLSNGTIQGCVTLHYNFPIGVSTVGRVIVPSTGKEMYIATTTGTTSSNRIEAMVKNTVNGVIAAKTCGIKEPTVGILNIDGANSVERVLKELKTNGYDLTFSKSQRADGTITMRGNDLLMGTPDVMVCDSLTGNLLMKIFSAYQTGGNYEAVGYGYGPGIGDSEIQNVCIISRASGAPVIANALQYAYELAKGHLKDVTKKEYTQAKKAQLLELCDELSQKQKNPISEEQVSIPKKEIVTKEISGIDVLDLDDALIVLWKENIYAESGMGCTGPIILVNEKNIEKAKTLLVKKYL
ncbi:MULTISPECIES: glycine/sarcosine/betaine reductase complex component C subunit alpha [Vagococcus]|uniref:Glycine/sarcosine/betaine reductase component C chain 2 n=1 Tax=Vagococcus fluvialis bH819 TaxID=1255619 RepID=A0A1X6WPM3_9ENTE|nr:MULTISPECIES: glycine/sarcosine/betaine reductase complex component C subunit alpha [Vagococcus]SLM86182.1 Glycine/sarcosine/betaine reductase component C chain 2 [Vagococcus fluvialis bH819]